MDRILEMFALVIFLFLMTDIDLQAQSTGCGTIITSGQKNLELTLSIAEGNPTESLPQLNRTLNISIYVVKNEQNLPGISSAEVQSAITRLNGFFQPVSLNFKICNTTFIDNYQFDNLSEASNVKELVSLYAEKNTINLFFTTRITDSYGLEVCGFTSMPAEEKNAIFIQKGCIAGTTLVHQIGHFLNLYHTNETAFGKELVNKSNCSVSGDKCCDTEADPGLDGLTDKSCTYTGKLKDSSGAFYQPKPKNIMSLSSDDCRCYFSKNQFLRMIFTLKNLRKELR